MANEWLRLWHDMPTDPKWRTISRASGQPISLVQAVYLHMLVDASRNVTRGHVTVTLEDLASALDVTEDQIQAVLTAMEGRVIDDGHLSGWESRQPKKEDSGNTSTEAKTPAQRKRDQRAREAESRDVTQSHDESRDVTLDKDKDKDKKEEAQAPSVPNWMPMEAWAGYLEMRKKIRKTPTERALKLVIKSLAAMHEKGVDIAQVLDNSTRQNWVDVYEPKGAPVASGDRIGSFL